MKIKPELNIKSETGKNPEKADKQTPEKKVESTIKKIANKSQKKTKEAQADVNLKPEGQNKLEAKAVKKQKQIKPDIKHTGGLGIDPKSVELTNKEGATEKQDPVPKISLAKEPVLKSKKGDKGAAELQPVVNEQNFVPDQPKPGAEKVVLTKPNEDKGMKAS